jgi:YHS domain-containing protein
MLRRFPSRRHAMSIPVMARATFVALILAYSGPVLADGTVNTRYFGGVAINGYDPVAYFVENRAVKGTEKYSYDWLGTPWHFANEEHRELFKKDPVKYAPQYGGYCAAEVAGSGSVTVNIDPEAFKIIDGKLYITYDKVHTQDFATHAGDVVPKAEANWPKKQAELVQDNYR